MEQLSEIEQVLVQKSKDVMKNAYCAYSKFPVGAAILAEDGSVILGANHENASYGGTICAERSAMCAALTAGHRKFKSIAICTELPDPASPCGLCRQFLIEFGNYKVILCSSTSDKLMVTSTKELLPHAFTPASLDEFENMKANK
ncbi:unnamed protein product [Auanema sp. JU1783]|nr:unnamed protein product [Auanema sp. JU1783]